MQPDLQLMAWPLTAFLLYGLFSLWMHHLDNLRRRELYPILAQRIVRIATYDADLAVDAKTRYERTSNVLNKILRHYLVNARYIKLASQDLNSILGTEFDVEMKYARMINSISESVDPGQLVLVIAKFGYQRGEVMLIGHKLVLGRAQIDSARALASWWRFTSIELAIGELFNKLCGSSVELRIMLSEYNPE